MPTYEVGDYVKVEFRDEKTSESEWMWVRLDSCDDANRLVFGRLDSVPVLDCSEGLKPVIRHTTTPFVFLPSPAETWLVPADSHD